MIVKIQQQLGGNTTPQQMLVYDKSRDYLWEGDITPEVKKFLKGRDKAYFNAKVVNTKFEIHEEVKTQNW